MNTVVIINARNTNENRLEAVQAKAAKIYREICQLKREFAMELLFDAELQNELRKAEKELESLAAIAASLRRC